jgi:predicted ester cyclase
MSAASTADATAANKAVVRAFVEAWNARDLTRFDDLMAEACRLTVGAETLSCSPAATRAIAEHWLAGFPDYRFELLDVIAEGDRVVARMPFSGTQTGPVLELPPTGRRVRVSEIVIFRLAEGKIVEAWEEYDALGMRQQLGVLPAPPTR